MGIKNLNMVINIKTEKIMKKILNISIVFLGAILLAIGFNSCEEENDYNWSTYAPVIEGGITGPTEVYASGLVASNYSINARGGSTFEWTLIGSTGTIVNDDDNYSAAITWDPVSDTTYAMVTVVETTSGGVSSEPDTVEVTLYEFCALPNNIIDDLMGSFVGSDDDDGTWYGPLAQPFELTKVDEGSWSMTGLFFGKYDGWGTLTDGGSAVVNFTPVGPDLVIEYQYYLTNDEGADWVYWIEGEGTWSNCGANPQIILYYDIEWHDPADGSSGWMWGGDDPAYDCKAVIDVI